MSKNSEIAKAQSNGRINIPDATTGDLVYLPKAAEDRISEYAFESDGFRQECPRLYTLLAKQVVNGKKREPATVRFFADGGRLKAAVHDRETSQTFWTTLEAKGQPMMELEVALATGQGEWRKDRTR